MVVGFTSAPRWLSEEGLFRIPGSRTDVLAKDKLLLEPHTGRAVLAMWLAFHCSPPRFMHGDDLDHERVFDDTLDPAVAAGLLKVLLARHQTSTGISRSSQEVWEAII